MQQIYKRTPMAKCNFNKIALQLIKLLRNFIEITLRYGCSPVYMLHISRSPFPKTTYEELVLEVHRYYLDVYLGPYQTFKIELFVKIVNGLTIFAKSFIVDVW